MTDPTLNPPSPVSARLVRITEVGPRDGLQNEAAIISTGSKVRFIDLLSGCGVAEIEVSSFVSPKWIPQLGDAAEVFGQISRAACVAYSALVPNQKGMEAALKAKADKVAVFAAASETFSRRNINASIAESLERYRLVIAMAKAAATPVRAYISCAVACPYEGPTDPGRVRDLAGKLLELGADEIDLADTIGVATPADIEKLYAVVAGLLEPAQTTLHLHDTNGRALDCARRAYELGVRSFDASCAGLGGCPFAPGSAGNLATEKLVAMLESIGGRTGVDQRKLRVAADHIGEVIRGSTPAATS